MFLNCITFHFSVLDNFWSILILIFLGGSLLRTPGKKFKNLKIWKVTPVTTYNSIFLVKNLFVQSKLGFLGKKTELNFFIFGRVKAILSSKGKNLFFVENIFSVR